MIADKTAVSPQLVRVLLGQGKARLAAMGTVPAPAEGEDLEITNRRRAIEAARQEIRGFEAWLKERDLDSKEMPHHLIR